MKTKKKQEPVGELTDLGMLDTYDLPLKLQSKPISSLEAQKIRSSGGNLPENHDLLSKRNICFRKIIQAMC